MIYSPREHMKKLFSKNHRLIHLSQGKISTIDVDDFPVVSKYSWHASREGKNWYAKANVLKNGKRTQIKMHRLILGASGGEMVDHKDHNGLNNCRSNIRFTNHSLNAANSHRKSMTGFKGVYKSGNKWCAGITKNYKYHHLGTFVTKKDAARAYNSAANNFFRQFALLNYV